MTNQLEELIEGKSIRCDYGVKPFIAGEKYIAVEDLKEFFKDKVIIPKDMSLQFTKRQHGKIYKKP